MKKYILAAALACGLFASEAKGEINTTALTNGGEFSHSGLFVNPTIGVMCGDVKTDFGLDVTAGYRWNVTGGFNWDVLKFGFNTGVGNFADDMTLRILTGVRYNTGQLFGGMGMYGDFAIGFATMTKSFDDLRPMGVGYEIGIGLNLTRMFSLGLVWEGNSVSDSMEDEIYGVEYETKLKAHYGTFGLRLGINF